MWEKNHRETSNRDSPIKKKIQEKRGASQGDGGGGGNKGAKLDELCWNVLGVPNSKKNGGGGTRKDPSRLNRIEPKTILREGGGRGEVNSKTS